MRKQIVAGNWKMNTIPADAVMLAEQIKELSTSVPKGVELIVAPPFTHIVLVAETLKNSSVKVSAQNCAAWDKGAYTGEVSAQMIAASGATHVIIGHSERREYFAESSKTLLEKVKLALSNGLTPIFCCGEVLEDRDASRHFQVVQKQLEEVLLQLTPSQMEQVVIAYEPVWAIGTGRTASPEQAQEMHEHIRSFLLTNFGSGIAENTSILYGGSCKPDNAVEIFAKPGVDGGLIGGASLKATDFIAIANSFPK